MYLVFIFIITLTTPFILMPKHIETSIASPYRIIIYSICMIAALSSIVLMIASFTGQGLYQQLTEITTAISKEAAQNQMIIDSFSQSGIGKEEIEALLIKIYDMSLMRLPVAIIFLGAIISYIAYILLSKSIGKRLNIKKLPPFREFSFPHGAAMAVMLMYLISWMMLRSEASVGEMMYTNINLLFDLVFSLQGVSVVLMFFHLKKAPKIIGVIAIIIMWITSIGRMFLMLIGMADLIMGLKIRLGGRAGRF